jgi:hypothetical protein
MDNCLACGHPEPEHCWNAFEKITTGWWCTKCNHFEKAIGRERQIAPVESTYGVVAPEEYSESEPIRGDTP